MDKQLINCFTFPPEPLMTSPVSSASHSVREQSAAPLSLLLDIPRDVVPNIFTRLPDPDLLPLAQVSKQLRIMLEERVDGELQEIGSLNGEQLWTRALDLAVRYGHLIDAPAWANFLTAVESQNTGHAMLLHMAARSFEQVERNECLATLQQPAASDFSPKEYATLHTLVRGADKEPWKERASAAAIAGQWRHAVRSGKNVDWMTLVSLVRQLPLLTQIRIMPRLEGHDCRDLRLLTPHVHLSNNHSVALTYAVEAEPPLPVLANASRVYLNCLSKMFVSHVNTSNQCMARDNLRFVVSGSLSNGMPLGQWRKEVPELAVFVLLALYWDREKESVEAGLGKQLLDCGFITKPEYGHFVKFMAKASGDKMNRVQQWMSLNRDKQVAVEPDSICTIS